MGKREGRAFSEPTYSIVVTGTRGKSSLVRLLAAGFRSLGISCRARLTGVVPTDISSEGARTILRSQGGHIEELRWWLRHLPSTEAVVVENSAVSPDLQILAPRWLRPRLIVVTNVRADHEELWGPGREGARRALLAGIPPFVPVLLGEELASDGALIASLRANPLILLPPGEGGYEASNGRLARAALAFFGLDGDVDFSSFLVDDPGRFRLVRVGSGLLACAFSANETESTELLWRQTGWSAEETVLLYNHRGDRPGRLRAFRPWIASRPWRDRAATSPMALPFPPRQAAAAADLPGVLLPCFCCSALLSSWHEDEEPADEVAGEKDKAEGASCREAPSAL